MIWRIRLYTVSSTLLNKYEHHARQADFWYEAVGLCRICFG